MEESDQLHVVRDSATPDLARIMPRLNRDKNLLTHDDDDDDDDDGGGGGGGGGVGGVVVAAAIDFIQQPS